MKVVVSGTGTGACTAIHEDCERDGGKLRRVELTETVSGYSALSTKLNFEAS